MSEQTHPGGAALEAATESHSRRDFLKQASIVTGATLLGTNLIPATQALAARPDAQNVTLNTWVFADFLTGKAATLLKTFASEFEKANPGITINLIGKTAPDIISGVIAGAGSGNLPDVITTQLVPGSALLGTGALKNIYSEWQAAPASYQNQFVPSVVKALSGGQKNTLWGIPFTGYAIIMFRNLAVLKKAGIDPKTPVPDWATWLAQAKQIKQAGAYATGNILGGGTNAQAVLMYYGGVPGASNSVTANGKHTTIDPSKLAQAFTFIKELQQYTAPVGIFAQAALDLFLANQMAFYTEGPFDDPTLEQAKANSGLDYDYVLIPGAKPGKSGGFMGGEFVGVMNGANAATAWKWATYLTDVAQMRRFASGLGRYVANSAALATPETKSNPLVQLTARAALQAVPEGPFLFKTPTQYWQPLYDLSASVNQGKLTSQAAATSIVQQMNKLLA